jgi:hypothetical protein
VALLAECHLREPGVVEILLVSHVDVLAVCALTLCMLLILLPGIPLWLKLLLLLFAVCVVSTVSIVIFAVIFAVGLVSVMFWLKRPSHSLPHNVAGVPTDAVSPMGLSEMASSTGETGPPIGRSGWCGEKVWTGTDVLSQLSAPFDGNGV